MATLATSLQILGGWKTESQHYTAGFQQKINNTENESDKFNRDKIIYETQKSDFQEIPHKHKHISGPTSGKWENKKSN